jgi:hypothetical protein
MRDAQGVRQRSEQGRRGAACASLVSEICRRQTIQQREVQSSQSLCSHDNAPHSPPNRRTNGRVGFYLVQSSPAGPSSNFGCLVAPTAKLRTTCLAVRPACPNSMVRLVGQVRSTAKSEKAPP